jgi:hypothetical protein
MAKFGDKTMIKNIKQGVISTWVILVTMVAACVAASAQIIPVGNVEELYAAVNDPANAGATVILGRGVYMLSANDPFGTARANGGRLDLQENMSLIGDDGDRSAVIIDAGNLPASSYDVVTPTITIPAAAIRMGRGHNSIEWLTVRNARLGTANIDTTLQSPGRAFVTIAHVASTGSKRGLDLIHSVFVGGSGDTIHADIVDNDVFNNNLGSSQGVRIINAGTSDGVINVRMTDNRSWGQSTGMVFANPGATNSTINVFSAGNQLFGNAVGTIISAAIPVGNGNIINLEAHGDRFFDNILPFSVSGLHGGLIVVGGEATATPNAVNSNTVDVALWGCRMERNNTWDLFAAGAFSLPESIGFPGVNNHVTIEIHGGGKGDPSEFFANSIPDDPSLNNSVTVIR